VSETIKRNELLHFSSVAARQDVRQLEPPKRAQLLEEALGYLYRFPRREQREELLSLIQGIIRDDHAISDLFTSSAYTVCNRHLVITFVNEVFLERSEVEPEEVLGKSLYYEREYEGTQIEQLYSMVMETRMMGDALVRYITPRVWGGPEHDGWFAIVVVPLEEGGIGVLSRFAKTKEELAEEIDPESPDAPRFITVEQPTSTPD
jgi:hypothetical protein